MLIMQLEENNASKSGPLNRGWLHSQGVQNSAIEVKGDARRVSLILIQTKKRLSKALHVRLTISDY